VDFLKISKRDLLSHLHRQILDFSALVHAKVQRAGTRNALAQYS